MDDVVDRAGMDAQRQSGLLLGPVGCANPDVECRVSGNGSAGDMQQAITSRQPANKIGWCQLRSARGLKQPLSRG